MIKWLSSLFLLIALSGGVFAGVLLHVGEQECPMSEMDCCKKALSQGNSAEVSAARLCCTVACEQSGSTTAAVKMPQFTSVVVVALYLSTFQKPSAEATKKHPQKFASKVSFDDSKPIFIRHHTLLI